MSLAQYRSIDLSLFAVMMIISETIIIRAFASWFPGELYTVSVTAAITAIVMMRWGWWAAIHAFLGGLVYCLVSGGSSQQFVIYCIGNLACLLAFFIIRRLGAERVRTDAFLSLVFAGSVQILMQLGRAAVSLLFGTLPRNALGFVTTDALSVLFTLVIIWIARRLDGVFENQVHYLLRIQEE